MNFFVELTQSEVNSGELLDEAQFEIGDEEEEDGHDCHGKVVLPEIPVGVADPQVLQVLLTCTPASTRPVNR